ncbi:MAG: hypothetical protein IH616_01050, partial [Gemmatimonadales bacterium]|nr:hypothetical protein [Gemmatimonadales bacterium]
MKMLKALLGLLVVLAIAAIAGWFSLDKETRGLLATLPTNADVLFWSQAQRDAAFRALDRLPVLAKSRVIPAGGSPRPLPPGPPLELPIDVGAYMAGQRSSALLVLHDGKLPQQLGAVALREHEVRPLGARLDAHGIAALAHLPDLEITRNAHRTGLEFLRAGARKHHQGKAHDERRRHPAPNSRHVRD